MCPVWLPAGMRSIGGLLSGIHFSTRRTGIRTGDSLRPQEVAHENRHSDPATCRSRGCHRRQRLRRALKKESVQADVPADNVGGESKPMIASTPPTHRAQAETGSETARCPLSSFLPCLRPPRRRLPRKAGARTNNPKFVWLSPARPTWRGPRVARELQTGWRRWLGAETSL